MSEATLEGWVPEPHVPLAEVVERAFDYRGNVTIARQDGSEIVGYVFNREARAPEPFLELYDIDGNGPLTVSYREIRAIRFTGRDMAAGNSYAAWLTRKEAAKAEGKPAPQR
jgi:hypothetical protein